MADKPIRVLIVDDNDRYREAFSRNLFVQGMDAIQAHHGDHAMELLKTESPDVMVTDLQMRTQTEGLDLIRDARTIQPILPIIMISAVGSFDEGAQASQLGASLVLSKARIEEDIEILYKGIRDCAARHEAARQSLDEVAALRKRIEKGGATASQASEKLLAIAANDAVDPYVRSEAFDASVVFTDAARLEPGGSQEALEKPTGMDRESIREELAQLIPEIDKLDQETHDALLMAEFLYRQEDTIGAQLEMTRTTCFSYCFSVENEAKVQLRKRISKFLADKGCMKLIARLQEKKSNQVSMFFQQHLLQLIRGRKMDFTIENVRQTFLRIEEHGTSYRPDGLKALGIMILTFGRDYEFKQFNETVRVENPLGLKGLDDEQTLTLAQSLINLQHLRNPYIHPEISGRAGIEPIRNTAIECLNHLMLLC